MVNVLLESIRKNQIQIAMEHTNALQIVQKDTFEGVETIMATIAIAASSSVRLQSQLVGLTFMRITTPADPTQEETELRADKVIEKQNMLEKNLDRLQKASHEMSLDVEGNYSKAESFIRSAAAQGAQLAVLPEYHLQGWVGSREALLGSARRSPEFLARYRALARELGVCIVPGTLLEDVSAPSDAHDEPALANVAYFLGPDGAVCGRYQKRNLWHPEKPLLRAPSGDGDGATPHHIAFDTPLGVRAGMLVCWDLSFPEAFRALAADGARLVVVPSFWVARDVGEPVNPVNRHAERLFLDTMCVARAFENSCAVVYVNCGGATAAEAETAAGTVREGHDAEGREHAGVSQAAMPMVGAVARIGHGAEEMRVVELDLGLLEVAEKAYKPRDDMERRGWKYEADVSGIWRTQDL
ncbi:Nitrilase/cyanide hydratase and apolipoprotein N-acyltransferase [Cordyceps fumosorosea ARSEF 2679]|uniref:Nitrilase/cyanide hydratase and apolipoprotein N-acyltransferase n=1 Tax=Cordyceps fumosorosea (strain ARSEF 2679) TaxID=1081104 RepID=A0A167WI52_CORFA|nr:Nitrilase/cyanide hydratase and apolipoprotein N-acyltransferase [Cordyceps fumosorosea ARSEF 2679]OAA63821.1 Nitrilase/cyanide hydratase and apolipoprotein N-acyltransferase [Cordyceps fumosorosea ARSEF 2679]